MGKIGSDCAILKECEEFLDSQVRIGLQLVDIVDDKIVATGKRVFWSMPGNYVPPAPMEYVPREKEYHEKRKEQAIQAVYDVLDDLLNIAKVHGVKLR